MRRQKRLSALHRQLVLSSIAAVLVSRAAVADFDPPPTYYNAALNPDGSVMVGSSLKSALYGIISTGTVQISYDNARKALQVIDEDVGNPEHMILFYDNTSLDLSVINPSGTNTGSNIKGWDMGVSWQREHTWPQSRQVGTAGATTSSGPDYSDLHMLRPAGASNQARSALNYGGSSSNTSNPSGPGQTVVGGITYYYAGNAHKGDAARASFYAAVRYNGSQVATTDLELVNGNPAINTSQMGDLASLLRWHYEDTVDTYERRRNDLVYSSANWSASSRYNDIGSVTYAQGNRNPFVDHPEWVWAIFGDQSNDSRLSVATPASDGTSSASVNIGRVIVGGSSSSLSQSVTISKEGDDPTYFGVSTTGSATASLTGRNNAFTYANGTRSMIVGLVADTSTTGTKSGTVIIDNLDITAGGGTGRGLNDGNDTITVSVDVINHSNASFNASSDVNSLSVNLGNVLVGYTAASAAALRNLSSGATASLDLDSISAAGDTSLFWLELTPFAGLSPGAADWFGFSFSPTSVGTFSVTYTLYTSDENIPGATSGTPLTLTLTGTGILMSGIPEPSSLLGCSVGLLMLLRPRRG